MCGKSPTYGRRDSPKRMGAPPSHAGVARKKERGFLFCGLVGDYVTTEPGNMVGPTRQGVQELIAKDPTARLVRGAAGWYVRSDTYPINESPRIVPIPLFDPTSRPGGGRITLRVSNIGAFFITGTVGRSVFGYFISGRLPGARPGRGPEKVSHNQREERDDCWEPFNCAIPLTTETRRNRRSACSHAEAAERERLMRLATIPAPKPLSILTTTTLAAQLLSIPRSAASPRKLAP